MRRRRTIAHVKSNDTQHKKQIRNNLTIKWINKIIFMQTTGKGVSVDPNHRLLYFTHNTSIGWIMRRELVCFLREFMSHKKTGRILKYERDKNTRHKFIWGGRQELWIYFLKKCVARHQYGDIDSACQKFQSIHRHGGNQKRIKSVIIYEPILREIS